MFKKLRDKAMTSLLRRQLKKQGLPDAQVEMILEKVQNDPSILELFKKAEEKIKEKKKQGMEETAAAMQVQREMQSEFQKAFMQK
jgi:DNA-binding transcriptional MerR regulator